MKLKLREVIQAISGTVVPARVSDESIYGISTDSRKIGQGELFIPLVGEQYDGHDYIINVIQKGAVASLWNRSKSIPEGITIPLILVEDTLKALQELARYYRNKVNPKVVGVTGSNGKTTTKDLIASVLSTHYRVHKTKGNYNNHIGVPLTLLNMPEDTEVAVIEMGMNNRGEIEILTQIAYPDLAVITNIGESHLEFLKTRENIAAAKLEITKGLKENGILILNGDEPLLRTAMEKLDSSYHVIWVGSETGNDRFPIEIRQNLNDVQFRHSSGEEYSLPLLGVHNVINGLMAIEVGIQLGVPLSKIKEGLKHPDLTSMRLEKTITKNGSTLINDAYNASPTSMRASLQILTTFRQYQKRIAILGDMFELGEQAEYYHQEIGQLCASLKLDLLVTTGQLGRLIASSAIEHGMEKRHVYHFENVDEIAPFINQHSDPDSIILVKASRGMHLERVVQQLLS
ncbi:UDP-N-acetylmuramoyl-tripeptide--D-alanyl-D-alanine ligase [Tepidibacillus fermentans]|uniref:UDP-N-acetylmuramoyl-tripeptide--D-alanyl-D-alanine ligase n=1 Tax=Tepidibacillus fermentans TaxID=1281767 RepID=A0A4R3KL08_9BACI|nr:UDP-N-acetylmuramoyl-tripeptide--D-alanyl-D-alanine ligase [Tepidibacillus fermentans]TCS84417.1 UDP-N-acetylmuramoyl-tripeptide--D-alanyl-D-alanine ligase [Tepidibacillus fermentans]